MSKEAIKFRNSVFFVVAFTMLLWLVKALEWAVALDFGFLGILPRTLTGTMGIVTAPLVHGDLLHLISNTFPLVLLGVSVFYFYDKIALEVFAWIYFMSGFWVWMAARDAYHIGASGIVYGLVAFLFFSGLFRRDARSLSISLAVIFLYGGMLHGLFPTNEKISWESHLLGALAGAFCAFFYRDVQLEEQRKEKHAISELGLVGEESGVVSSYSDYEELIDNYPLMEREKEYVGSGRDGEYYPMMSGRMMVEEDYDWENKSKENPQYVYYLKEKSTNRMSKKSYIYKLSYKTKED